MKLKQCLISLAAACILVAGSVSALELGDEAPELRISNWVKGSPVNLAEANTSDIFIIEFWATWCGPCKKNIPHLTDLQAKFTDRGLVVIGVSSEDSETVTDFVAEQGDNMAYTVAVDDDNMTDKAYLQALGVRGIPHAVVVQDGKIAWSGHPDQMDRILQLIMDGSYDHRALKLIPKYFQQVRALGLSDDVKAMGEIIYEAGKLDAFTMNTFAWDVLTSKKIKSEHRDLDLARKVARAAYELTEAKNSAVIDTYALAVFHSGDKAGAITLQRQAMDIEVNEHIKALLAETLAKYQAAL